MRIPQPGHGPGGSQPPAAPPHRQEGLPPGLEALVLRLLAKNPADPPSLGSRDDTDRIDALQRRSIHGDTL